MTTIAKPATNLEHSVNRDEAAHSCCMSSAISRAVLGGLAGTVAITMMMYLVAPMMLGQPMDVARMLGYLMGDSWWAGMTMHFVIGSLIFPLFYALVLYKRLPGVPVVKGLIWGVALWLLAQVAVMPMMGGGFFSGGIMPAMGSLMGHVAYGAILGAITGTPKSRPCSADRSNGC